MFSRAQAGLEYLMTYGWALVLIVTVAAVLFFLFSSSTAEKVTFSLSNNRQILFKTGNYPIGCAANSGEILLQNASGGNITVISVESTIPPGDTDIKVNGSPVGTGITIVGGQQIKLTEINISEGTVSGNITITYTDKDGYSKTATITANGKCGTGSGGGLVAYYNFNEGSGTSIADSSGNGNNGSLSGSFAWESNCPSGKQPCLTFSGGYVEIPYNANFNMSNSVTIMAWVNSAPLGSYRTVAAKDKSGILDPEYWFGVSYDKATFMINPGTADETDRFYVPGNSIVADSTWHHIAAVFNGTDVRIYVDGQLNNTPSVHSVTVYSSDGSFHIGTTLRFGSAYNFIGSIDEIRLYDRALDATEIAALYSAS